MSQADLDCLDRLVKMACLDSLVNGAERVTRERLADPVCLDWMDCLA